MRKRTLLLFGLLLGTCLTAFLLPTFLFRVKYGDPPLPAEKYRTSLQTIKVGMTFEEVRAILGNAHEQRPNFMHEGDVAWIYYTDPLGWGYLGVHFGPDERVQGQWIP